MVFFEHFDEVLPSFDPNVMSLESHIILEHRDPSIVNIQIPDPRDALVIEALTHPHTSIQCNRRRGREIHGRCTESR